MTAFECLCPQGPLSYFLPKSDSYSPSNFIFGGFTVGTVRAPVGERWRRAAAASGSLSAAGSDETETPVEAKYRGFSWLLESSREALERDHMWSIITSQSGGKAHGRLICVGKL